MARCLSKTLLVSGSRAEPGAWMRPDAVRAHGVGGVRPLGRVPGSLASRRLRDVSIARIEVRRPGLPR
ncbi:hypothetical protein Aph01nite_56990 [Acrocarpospora phusangensis]|uniref:Uncharacterized protein n=1 Tax=Acrocarpospora phusangensis TaxID=1070424 RepID=A0A919QDU8_9ACTN|nr:hypothetical protein Aph01nite_56990 [Acrocarpospora phusangensis]